MSHNMRVDRLESTDPDAGKVVSHVATEHTDAVTGEVYYVWCGVRYSKPEFEQVMARLSTRSAPMLVLDR